MKQNRFLAAIEQGKTTEVLASIISDGVDINVTDRIGRTPLMIAASKDDLDVMKFLLSHNVNVNESSKSSRETALMITANNLNLDACKLLIQNGALINNVSESKATALHMAVFATCEEFEDDIAVIDLLVNSGAKFNSKDEDGKTCVDIAMEHERNDILGLFK